jgi:uncharacterized membrane protein YedE/YeeE
MTTDIFGLLLIGILLGTTLSYFQFGFSSSFRLFIQSKESLGVRSIVIMIGFCIISFSLITDFSETSPNLMVSPVSLAVAIGAFLFGIGMQMSTSGCTSGTLNKTGQLQPLSWVTLVGLIIGGTIAAFSYEFWSTLPKLESLTWQGLFNSSGLGLLFELLLCWSLYRFLWHKDPNPTPILQTSKPLFSRLQGKSKSPSKNYIHPFLIAALLLAILNTALLWFYQSPWAIASIFPFWGVSLIEFFQIDIDWRFWEYSMTYSQIESPFFSHNSNVVALGLIFGALLASLLKRSRLKKTSLTLPNSTKPRFQWLYTHFTTPFLGGVIMGFSALMASGCNIGALFSGIASGSLHGWQWLIFAIIGNITYLKILNSK